MENFSEHFFLQQLLSFDYLSFFGIMKYIYQFVFVELPLYSLNKFSLTTVYNY